MQSPSAEQESPTFPTPASGVTHAPEMQLCPEPQARQVLPLTPQLMAEVWFAGMQALPVQQPPQFDELHEPDEPPPEPPEPPPEPPPAPPQVKLLQVVLPSVCLEQSSQVMPDVPQVVLRALLPPLMHVPVASQHPSLQLAGPQFLLPPHEGATATTKPSAAPIAKTFQFIIAFPISC